ncbi:MAG: hypothetical protein RJA66_1195 [Actinomycetota bacterium]|jgi:hypothetical protein
MYKPLRLIALICSAAVALSIASPAEADFDYKSSITGAFSEVSAKAEHQGMRLLSNLAGLNLEKSAKAYVARTSGTSITIIPVDPSLPVQVTARQGVTVLIGMPFSQRAEEAQLIAEGAVTYDNQNASTSTVIAKADGSVQIATVLASAEAPTRYSYELTLPAGVQAKLGNDGGVVFLGASGKHLGGIAPAWSRDARGADVPTHYELSASTLTQIVDHQNVSYAYPVVADPWLGLELIDRTTWQSKTLQVFPTLWGRLADTGSRWAAWDEVLSKTPGNRENTASMRDQLYCHVDFVRKVDPFKTSWNLDLDRPYSDYLTLVLNKCNNPK